MISFAPASYSEKTLSSLPLQESLALRCAIPIEDCGEPLVTPKDGEFHLFSPHPYQQAGAPYSRYSPYSLRAGVLARLLVAQDELFRIDPTLRLKLYDCYRPLAVQRFMIEHSVRELALKRKGVPEDLLAAEDRKTILAEVLQIWAPPNEDPKAPPPHSTGAAVDLTLVRKDGSSVDMGSEIDAMPPLSAPRHFEARTDSSSRTIHYHRELLHHVMRSQGLRRLPHEWWHFSYGDQQWALMERLDGASDQRAAWYGRVE